MNYYTFRGKNLKIDHFADIQRTMRPGERFSQQVQELLDDIEPWKEGRDPIETMHFDNVPILPMAVPRGYAKVVWGVHRGHRARRPGLSPFVDRGVPHELMGWITLEFKGPADDPILTRAYGGDYTPPLPWMVSAGDAEGGIPECLKYWQTNAYLSKNYGLIQGGSRTRFAPEWSRT